LAVEERSRGARGDAETRPPKSGGVGTAPRGRPHTFDGQARGPAPAAAAMTRHEFHVPEDFDGQRLDLFLVSVLGDRSRSQIQKLIADGHVHLARKAPKANLALKAGE